MKILRKAVAMVLSVVMLCLTAVGVSADVTEGVYKVGTREFKYPLPSRFFTRFNEDYTFGEWWYHEYGNNFYMERGSTWADYHADLWLDWVRTTDPEILPQCYRDVYARRLDNTNEMFESPIDPDKPQFRVDGFSWEDRTLTLNWSADYKIRYYVEIPDYLRITDPGYGLPHMYVSGDGCRMYPAIVIKDKEDSGLVGLYIKWNSKAPEYKYGEHGQIVPEGVNVSDIDGKEYFSTVSLSVPIDMPWYFDPEKHDIEIYFYYHDDYSSGGYGCDDSDHGFITPAYEIATDGCAPRPTGDVDYNGVVNLSDATAMLKCIAGWNVEIKQELADVTGDGTVDLIDVMSVLKKAAGWI